MGGYPCCCDGGGGGGDPVEDCDSYPLHWLASLGNGVSLPAGSAGFHTKPAATDTHSRKTCDATSSEAFALRDYSLSDGDYELTYVGGDVWDFDSIPYDYYTINLTPNPDTVDFVDNRNATLTVEIAEDCQTGPGDVNITATLINNDDGTTVAASWEATVTLSSGQKLLDYGPIAMTATGSFRAGYDYPYNGTCTGLSGSSIGDATDVPTLTLTPNG